MIKTDCSLRLTLIAATSGAMLFGLAGQAFAVPQYVKQACKADYKKFCPGYEIGTPALRACMIGIAHQLSPRCIDALERSGEKRK
jgi:hypothetical protein